MNTLSDFRALAREHPERAALVAAFNAAEASRARLDRLAPWLDPDLAARFREKPRSNRRLSRYLALCLPELAEPAFDFNEPAWRLALLPSDVLYTLVLMAGAALHAPALSRLIRAEDVAAVKGRIGERALAFALTRAGLLLGPLPMPGEPFSPREAERTLLAAGGALLGDCLAGAPRALLARLALKLPPACALAADRPPQGEAGRRAFLVLRKLLLKEVGTSWAPLFT